MTWYFHNTSQEVSEADISNYFGFVYIITHIPTGKKYIGKKFFTKSKTKQVKGKKKKIKFLNIVKHQIFIGAMAHRKNTITYVNYWLRKEPLFVLTLKKDPTALPASVTLVS